VVSTVRVHAPGRVNLIGGHSDYTGGLVLPMAIDLGTTLEGTRGGDRIELRSDDEPQQAVVSLGRLDEPHPVAGIEPRWARYVAAVAAAIPQRTGFAGTVVTTIPIGTGLSSSAALEVAVALALGADDDGKANRPALAEVLRDAELVASGVPCGVMDQLSSLCGVQGHAILLDCTTLEVTPVRVPDAARIVVVNSGEIRSLAGVPYAQRRDETVRAAELLGGPGSPRSASRAEVDAIADPMLRRRARHVVTENERVRGVCEAFAAGDLVAAGALMTESHASLRDDQEVTTSRLDELVERLVATPGVHGARLTGGGWGGCVVALCDRGALEGEGWHVQPSAGATVTLTNDELGAATGDIRQ
jgi:galactokinase